jgi:hypothetical protein
LGQGNASTYLAQPETPYPPYFQKAAGAKSIRAQPDGTPRVGAESLVAWLKFSRPVSKIAMRPFSIVVHHSRAKGSKRLLFRR